LVLNYVSRATAITGSLSNSMDNLNLSLKQQNGIFISFLVFLVFASFYIISSIEQRGTHHLNISTLPDTASISINGLTVGKDTLVKPGVYVVTIKNDGFFDSIEKIIVTDANYNIQSDLVPKSDTAKKWVSDNSSKYAEGSDNSYALNPIMALLPYGDLIYNISTNDSRTTTDPVTLQIETLSGYANAPIEKIRQFEYDPTNYRYVFNIGNPFENE
jgi:PEGA domain